MVIFYQPSGPLFAPTDRPTGHCPNARTASPPLTWHMLDQSQSCILDHDIILYHAITQLTKSIKAQHLQLWCQFLIRISDCGTRSLTNFITGLVICTCACFSLCPVCKNSAALISSCSQKAWYADFLVLRREIYATVMSMLMTNNRQHRYHNTVRVSQYGIFGTFYLATRLG